MNEERQYAQRTEASGEYGEAGVKTIVAKAVEKVSELLGA